MKHIKKFENNTEWLWIVVTEDHYNTNDSHQELYKDKESAENDFLEIVNNYFENKEKNNSNLITSVEEAEEYVKEELDGIATIYYYKTNIQDKLELREDIKIARDAKKYNI